MNRQDESCRWSGNRVSQWSDLHLSPCSGTPVSLHWAEDRLGCYYDFFFFSHPMPHPVVLKESFLHLLTHGCARSFRAWRLCHIRWRLLRPRGCNRNSHVSQREKKTKGTVFQFSRFGLALSLGRAAQEHWFHSPVLKLERSRYNILTVL